MITLIPVKKKTLKNEEIASKKHTLGSPRLQSVKVSSLPYSYPPPI